MDTNFPIGPRPMNCCGGEYGEHTSACQYRTEVPAKAARDTDTPTAAELERARRYLATVQLHFHEFTDGGVIISGLPTQFHTVFGATKDDAMNTLVHNVAEVFRSVSGVLFEEAAKVCEGPQLAPAIGRARLEAAAAIRRLAAGETTT